MPVKPRERSLEEEAALLPEPEEPEVPLTALGRFKAAAIQVAGPIAAFVFVWMACTGVILGTFWSTSRVGTIWALSGILPIAMIGGAGMAAWIVGRSVVETWQEMRRRREGTSRS